MPEFDFELEREHILLRYRSLTACTIHYYELDPEVLFSRAPFDYSNTKRVGLTTGAQMERIELPQMQTNFVHPLPDRIINRHCLIEIEAEGKRLIRLLTNSQLRTIFNERSGQLRVVASRNGKSLTKVYVKVYVKNENDSVSFHKDGYTDLRGIFDYATVTDNVEPGSRIRPRQFSILLLSPNHGSAIEIVDAP